MVKRRGFSVGFFQFGINDGLGAIPLRLVHALPPGVGRAMGFELGDRRCSEICRDRKDWRHRKPQQLSTLQNSSGTRGPSSLATRSGPGIALLALGLRDRPFVRVVVWSVCSQVLHRFLRICARRSRGLVAWCTRSCRWKAKRWMRSNPLSWEGRFSSCWTTQALRFEHF